jgi:hypothetical protein
MQLCRQREVQALLLWPLLCLVLGVAGSVRDIVLGALLMHAMHTVYQWLMQPGPTALDPICIPDFKTLPILQVPAAREYQPLQKYEVIISTLLIQCIKGELYTQTYLKTGK